MMIYIQIAILAALVSLIPRVNKEGNTYVSYNLPKLKKPKVPIQSRHIRGKTQIRNTIDNRG